jgi:hypothetical protein
MAKKKKCACEGGVDLWRLAAVSGGAVGAKLINYPIKKGIEKVLPEEKMASLPEWQQKGIQLTFPALKVAGGAYAQTMENQYVKDAGMGVLAVGAIEAIDILIPAVDMSGVSGVFDDFEHVGNTVEIDLDDLSGADGFDRRLESHQQVASTFASDYLQEEMQLAGYDVV